jgi:hypothetical protein
MTLRVVTHVEDGLGTLRKTIEAETAEDWAMLQNVFQRACNLWPDAPAKVKEIADVVTNGKVLQSYESQDTSPEARIKTASKRQWQCLHCKSNNPDYHGTLDDGVTPCPNRKY